MKIWHGIKGCQCTPYSWYIIQYIERYKYYQEKGTERGKGHQQLLKCLKHQLNYSSDINKDDLKIKYQINTLLVTNEKDNNNIVF